MCLENEGAVIFSPSPERRLYGENSYVGHYPVAWDTVSAFW